MSVDFKVRRINGILAFVGFDYQKFTSNRCSNADSSCVSVSAYHGEAKMIYLYNLYTNGVATPNKIKCNSRNIGNCSYAWLDASKSRINQTVVNYSFGPLEVVDWSIGFDPIVVERIYDLYANSFMNDSRPQGWRRIGAVLANPTTPNGTLKVNSVSNGNVNLGIKNMPTDYSGSIKGVGNVFFSNHRCWIK